MAEPTEADRQEAQEITLQLDMKRVSGGSLVRKPWAIADLIASALAEERERTLLEAMRVADGVRDEWRSHAANIARADDLVGGLAQSTYTRYADIAEKIADGISKLQRGLNG